MDRDPTPGAAIEALYQTYHPLLLRYLGRLVGDPETAEDLCQEAFVKALFRWDQLRAEASAQAWLFRIARNTAFDHLRRRRQIPMLPLDDRSIEAVGAVPSVGTDDADTIWETLRHLPENYRVPLVLHVAGGYAPIDIATLLGSNAATVRTRLYRARAQFRALYERYA
jgi:RNA polymerase sigma-70 factor, ECF subfamily